MALALGTAAATWKAVEARAEAARALTVKKFLGEMIGATDFRAHGRRLGIVEVLDAAEAKVKASFGHEPEIEAEIRHLIGLSYGSASELPKSIEQLRLALEIRQRMLGKDHPDTLATAHSLAEKVRENWQWPEAAEILRPVVEARRRTLGDDHLDTLKSILLLGDLLGVLGERDDAELLLSEAEVGFTQLLGRNSEEAILTRREIMVVAFQRGRNREGQEQGEQLLVDARSALGEEHWVTLDVMRALGVHYFAIGEYERAFPLLRSSLETRSRLFGQEDDVALYWKETLGWSLHRHGQSDEGERMMREAVSTLRAVYGDRNLRALYAMIRLGRLTHDRGYLDEAEQLLRLCVDNQLAVLGDDHLHPPETMSDLASARNQRAPRTSPAQMKCSKA
jgi:tetratricopeptide (TPR) repeat protein